MQEPQISTDEIYSLMQQLYPDQTARVVAELRAAKYHEILEQIAEATEQGESNGTDSEGEALREVPRPTGTDSSSGDS